MRLSLSPARALFQCVCQGKVRCMLTNNATSLGASVATSVPRVHDDHYVLLWQTEFMYKILLQCGFLRGFKFLLALVCILSQLLCQLPPPPKFHNGLLQGLVIAEDMGCCPVFPPKVVSKYPGTLLHSTGSHRKELLVLC